MTEAEANAAPTDAVATVMSEDVTEALLARLDKEALEVFEERGFAPLLVLDSGSRLGLSVAKGEAGAWTLVSADAKTLTVFDERKAMSFVELVENERRGFEERLEKAAAEAGLPAEPVLFSLPAVELVRGLVALQKAHIVRLSLLWLLPTELRALRGVIAAQMDNEDFPKELRELAARLVVPA